MRIRGTAAALATATLLVACGGSGTSPDDEPAGQSEPDQADDTAPDAERDGGESSAGDDEALQEATEQAVADAADATGVAPDDITVVAAERVTWSDGALGCPEGDEMYTQALVEGYRIELEADGQTRHYHGQDGDAPFHCADPQPPADP